MKTCVFISGTNAVGKSTLAKAIINHFGGIDRYEEQVTYCANGNVSLAGKYDGNKYGGVDRVTNEQGNSCTSRLAEVVENALRNSDIVFCEGSFMHTFGINLQNALFKADRHLVVNLWAEPMTIWNRLIARSGEKKRNFEVITNVQRTAMMSARKWQSIGVKVLQFNTATMTVEEELDIILHAIEEITKE